VSARSWEAGFTRLMRHGVHGIIKQPRTDMMMAVLTALSLPLHAREGRADPARSVSRPTRPLEPPGRRCGCWPMSLISF
jgi:hypothetical protein